MEKLNTSEVNRIRRQDSLQILDIGNHLRTLIHVGYMDDVPISRYSSNLRTDKLKASSARRAIMNKEMFWRRWRSKVHGSAKELDFWARKRTVNEQMQVGSSANSHFKNLQPNLNVVNYNNVYNGVMMTQPVYNEKRNNYTNLKPEERGTFKDYCNQCTIHGLKYVGNTFLPKYERIFWMISVMLALSGAAFYIWHLYSKFTTSPIIISRSPVGVFIDQIPFPALTICNMNSAKKSFADEINRGNDKLQKFLLEDICDKKGDVKYVSEDVKEKAGESSHIVEFLNKAAQDCGEMLYHCRWNSNVKNCQDLFNPVYTDEGICCNFNSVRDIYWKGRTWDGLNISYASDKHINWNPEYVFTKNDPAWAIPLRGHGSGASHGLSLALDVNVGEYYCSSTASVGFKMLLHSPVETPQIADYGFTLSPGKETRVIITPSVTDADKSIMKISPRIRQCYFLNERKLRYYRTYTQRNCQLECEANFTLELCDCMQYYMPAEADTKICGKTDDLCTARAKKIMNNKLEEDDDYNHDFNRSVSIPSCKCYPGCYEIEYSTEISQSMLVATFEVDRDFFKHNASYFEKNVAIVHVFYIDSSYMKYTKNELYGFAELLSNTGGLLGLFMGFSLVSVTEIMYYILLRIQRSLQKRRISKKAKKTLQRVKSSTINQDIVYPFTQ